MNFTIFDIIIILIILSTSLIGFFTGAISLVINLISFVASVAAAIFIYPFIYEILTKFLANEVILVTVSGSIAYLLSLLVINFFASKIIGLFSEIRKGIIDRLLGLFIGFLKACIISSGIFLITIIFISGSYIKSSNVKEVLDLAKKEKYPSWLKRSVTCSFLDNFSQSLILLIPVDKLESIKIPKEPVQANDITDLFGKENKSLDDNT